MNRKDIGYFLMKLVTVAIPHLFRDDRPFFYTGVITEITDENITLKRINNQGIIEIPIDEIIEIKSKNWECRR